jgi:hypothetical protein
MDQWKADGGFELIYIKEEEELFGYAYANGVDQLLGQKHLKLLFLLCSVSLDKNV